MVPAYSRQQLLEFCRMFNNRNREKTCEKMKNKLFIKARSVWQPWPLYPVSKKPGNLFGRKFGGFTLIELMVVVAIIAIISAIVVPMLISRVEKSQIKTVTNR